MTHNTDEARILRRLQDEGVPDMPVKWSPPTDWCELERVADILRKGGVP